MAISLGIGAAIAGGGCGIAAADEPSGSGTEPSSTDSGRHTESATTGTKRRPGASSAAPTGTDATEPKHSGSVRRAERESDAVNASAPDEPAKPAKPDTPVKPDEPATSDTPVNSGETDDAATEFAQDMDGGGTPDEPAPANGDVSTLDPADGRTDGRAASSVVRPKRAPLPRVSASVSTAMPQLSVESIEVSEPTRVDPVTDAPEPVLPEMVTIVHTEFDDPAPERAAAGVGDVVVDAVSTLASRLLNPFAADVAPAAPAVEPAMWMTLAAARRELETIFVAPSARPGDTAAADELASTISASTMSVAQEAPAAGSLTYTAPPNIIDQVTVFGLRILRTVSTVIGVDLFAEFNKLLISKSPPFFLTFGLHARQTEVELSDGTSWQVWEFQPPEPSGRTVIAVHGSGFIYEPNLMQWYDYTSMARDTGATVLVPIYPLATTEAGSALNVVPDMADFISMQIDRYGAENVSVYGDSAGSIISVSAVRQLVMAEKPVPGHMVLLSLTPDGSLSNPDIHTIDDPVVDVDHLGDYATTHWADGLPHPGDPYYNALNFETLAGLPPTTIYVGSLEFVLPDTLLLYQKAVDEGAPISVVVGQGQIHDWALGGLPINSQAPVVRKDVYRQLGLIA